MDDFSPSAAACIARIREILAEARGRALRSVNAAMVAAYWEIGREIVTEEQRGKGRAEYGANLIAQLAAKLSTDFGRGFSGQNLRLIRQFYLTYADRTPSIRYAVSTDSPPPGRGEEICYSVSSKSPGQPQATLHPRLTWTHYRVIMRVPSPEARSFYEVECSKAEWSVRELERQIGSLLFERLARSRDKEGLLALTREGHEVRQPSDLVKDPYVLEFVGLPESARWQETDLENALIDRLQQFLLELGRDLYFVARQKRITIDGDHFYVDLVFYHRALRCFVLIDLKLGHLSQQDIGQMLLYTGYFEAEEMREGENPPIGLILCTEKNEAVVRYTLSRTASQIFASRYQLHLPTEAELAEELQRERQEIEENRAADPLPTQPPPETRASGPPRLLPGGKKHKGTRKTGG